MKRILGIILVFSLAVQPQLFSQQAQKKLIIVNGIAESISSVDLSTSPVTVTHTESNIYGLYPNEIIVYNSLGYIVNSGSSNISVISLKDYSVEKTIQLPESCNPYDMSFVGLEKVYITGFNTDKVYVVNVETGAVIDTIDVGVKPEGLLRVGETVYVANTGFISFGQYGQGTVSIIDTKTNEVTAELDVPTNPQLFAMGSDGKIYVLCTGDYGSTSSGKLAVLETLYPAPDYTPTPTITDTIDIGGSPGDIEFTSTGCGFIAAGGEWGSGTKGYIYLYDINTDSVLRGPDNPIIVGNGATRILVDDETDEVFVSCFQDDKVQKLDPADGTVLSTYLAGDGAQCLALYTDYGSNDPYADVVVSFIPGAGANPTGGPYFPASVLGPPDRSRFITDEVPTADPKELLSLGNGGEVILQFTNNVIVNGPGVDFTVFENPFYSSWIGGFFIEAGIVSVSQDGETWYTFPYDTATFMGLAGKTPTKLGDPTNPTVSGGDSFDLDDLTVTLGWARYVKITDLGDIKVEGSGHGDFDLDAIAAVNSSPNIPSDIENAGSVIPTTFSLKQNYPNPFNPATTINYQLPRNTNVTLTVYNILGQEVVRLVNQYMPAGRHSVVWNGRTNSGQIAASGVYIYRIMAGNFITARKMLLVR